jgi:hypothetical protein
MANRLSEEKAQAIAVEYWENSLTAKQLEIGKESVQQFIEIFHLALWMRKIGTANRVIRCIENMRGLKLYITEKQAKWLCKAKGIIRWVLLPENRELRRGAYLGERSTKEYNDWRIAVLSRDNRTCQECGDKKNIITHHKKSYLYYPKLRIDVNNGVTLCRECHTIEHRK